MMKIRKYALLLICCIIYAGLQAQEIAIERNAANDILKIELLNNNEITESYIGKTIDDYIKQNTSHPEMIQGFANMIKETLSELMQSEAMDNRRTAQILRTIINKLDNTSCSSAIPSIVAYYYGIDIAVEEPSIIADRLVTGMKIIGSPAPYIEGVSTERMEQGNIILLYHDSSCDRCDAVMQDIKSRYQIFESRGYEIISISADTDKKPYDEYMEQFPWQYKLCDYKNYAGINFINYGIARVPALILIDEKGVVVDSYSRVMDLTQKVIVK